jgi:23S rRNA (cytidine1920-2'-O)/16S rRNA (cytidine1409-2'-O)-methyltransferase
MRLDQALVERSMVDSRSKAQHLIRAGVVWVSGRIVTKPSHQVVETDDLHVSVESVDVGRGAIKLRHALHHFGIAVAGKTVVDVGASTGGFTQVCLDQGAAHVIAIDVGHGQLDARLVSDLKVTNLEGVNILDITPHWWASEGLARDVELCVADLSFISLQKVVPKLVTLFPAAELVLLVKPQFEVGKGKTRGGIVTNDGDREEALRRVMEACRTVDFTHVTSTVSPIEGKKGNVEFLVHSSRRDSTR